jgi:hypothetical protein
MKQVAKFPSKKRLPGCLIIMETPTWNKYRKQVLYLLNEVLETSSPLAGYYPRDDIKMSVVNWRPWNTFLEQYDFLNWFIIDLIIKIGEVDQLTNKIHTCI